MSEEEIKALALSLGLDSKRLLLFEPFQWNYCGELCRRYRFEYKHDDAIFNFDFILGRADIEAGAEGVLVRMYVDKGLRYFAEKVTA